MSVSQIQAAICQLSDDERLALSEWVLDTMPVPADDDAVIRETVAIAEQRRAEIEGGRVKDVSWEEFWRNPKAGNAE
jgi:hypothetical protein